MVAIRSQHDHRSVKVSPAFSGLDLLATAVILLDQKLRVKYANPAAENLFELSAKNITGQSLNEVFRDPRRLNDAISQALADNTSYIEHDLELATNVHAGLHVNCSVTPVEHDDFSLLVEFRAIDQALRHAREERMMLQQEANRELLRNLAHEIKNPLGGIRGAAQLLEHELPKPALHEYTQVIIKEADRLQSLMDRLLTPNRPPRFAPTNVHELLERVRSLVLAGAQTPRPPLSLWGFEMVSRLMMLEETRDIVIHRDYDVSLPEIMADEERLIQALLNIALNAVQALKGSGEITFLSRSARQVTLARKRHLLAVKLQIIDNGPGIPEAIRETLFYPLVSGREGGTGLGLTLAQTYINQHRGSIECESRPGHTCFTIMLPVENEGLRRKGER